MSTVTVTCELNTSVKCRKKYQISKSNFNKIIKNNNGKIICRYCSFFTKYKGRNNPNSKYKFNDNFFSKLDSPEKAYLLGWIASDGHVGKFGFTISIHGDDFECLYKLRDIICPDVPIITFYDKKYKHNNVRLKINSQQISQDICCLLGINPGKKSYTVKFPDIKAPELIREFVKGYFEGDGTLNNRINSCKKIPICGITSKSKFILDGLEKIGFKHHHQDSRWINWSGKNAIKFLDCIYTNTLNVLKRKYELYLDWKINFIPDKNIGELHYCSKLTEKNVKEIINSDLSQNKLSKIYGVSRRTIQDIINGKTWKKITLAK